MSPHRRGLLFGGLGVAVIIPDATLVRLIDAPSLTTSVWRTGLTALSLGVFLAVSHRSRLGGAFWSLGAWGVASAVLSGLGTILFVVAIDNTAVANVLLILALSPMWAALLTVVALGGTVPRRTILAIPLAFFGVAVAVAGSFEAGVRSGDVVALVASLSLVGNLTIIRARSHVDMIPAVAAGNLLGCLALAGAGTSMTVATADLAPLLLLGLVVVPAALALITMGARHLSSPEMTLLLLAETALSPLLAAVVVDEPIEQAAYVGGAIVLATLALHAGLGFRDPNVRVVAS